MPGLLFNQQTQIAVSQQWREKLRGTIDFADLPCEHAGRWQIYAGLDLRPRLLAAAAMQPPAPPLADRRSDGQPYLAAIQWHVVGHASFPLLAGVAHAFLGNITPAVVRSL